MSSIVLSGDTSGAITIAAPAVAGTNTLTLPANTGTVLTTASSGQSIPKAALPTGSILQVINTFKSDTTSATNAASLDTWVDISGISVTITPTSSTSKILVLFTLNIGSIQYQSVAIQILRDSTAIGNGDASGSRLQCFADIRQTDQYECELYNGQYLDSPATTSAITYKIQWRKPYDYNSNTSTIYLNRSNNDGDTNDRPRCSSSITVMEISA